MRYELTEGGSSKFWEIVLEGRKFRVSWGRIATTGQTQTKTFKTPDQARAAHDTLVAEKVKKGYRTSAKARKPQTTTTTATTTTARTSHAAELSEKRVASFLAYLDEASRQGNLPVGENAKGTCGAMRVSGWTWGACESLVFESIFYWRADDVFARQIDAFTMTKGAGRQGDARAWLLTEDDLRENIDDASWRSKVSGIVFRFTSGHGKLVQLAPKTRPRSFGVEIGGRTVSVPLEMPALRGIKLKNRGRLSGLSAEDLVLFQLCDRVERDRLFPVDRALYRKSGIPPQAVRAFVFDDWQHPEYEAPASGSPDIVAMVRALVSRTPLRALPGVANCDWRLWLDGLLATLPR